MLKKKSNLGKQTCLGWDTYKENFSDLLEQETPKRKRRKSRKSLLRPVEISSFSQEIQTESSDDDVSNNRGIQHCVEDNFYSPRSPILINSPRFPINSEFKIKSTPSGSPILHSQKKSTTKSLIPLSPITPGLRWDCSLQNKSAFSIHLHDSGHERSNFDQTPLAVPLLDLSEDEIEENHSESDLFVSGEQNLQDTLEIEQIDTQTTHKSIHSITEYNENEPDFSGSGFSPYYKKQNVSNLNTTGTKWLKGIKDKIEEDWQREALRCVEADYQDLSYYDSGKKNKFVNGGLAEQLNRVLRKETSKKSVFLHQLKSKKIEQQTPEALLKIISDQKEGALHIIECKMLSQGEKERESHDPQYLTLMLPHDFVSNLELNLGATFKLYPPFYTLNIGPLQSKVLLCAYYIHLENKNPSGDSPVVSKTVCKSNISQDISKRQNLSPEHCESLLKSLEKQSSTEESFSVIATVQRVFCKTFLNACLSWSLLCEDAYGTFFIVEIDETIAEDKAWSDAVKSCEGQRIVFEDLYLGSRGTRSQFPGLFSIIDSIWCGNGQGLRQVQSGQVESQSTSGENTQDSVPLLPPSYCYLLHTKNKTCVNMPFQEREKTCTNPICKSRIPPVTSELNRPRNALSPWGDILYKPINILRFFECQELDVKSNENSSRFSMMCKFVRLESVSCSLKDLDVSCGEHNKEYRLFGSDGSLKKGGKAALSVSVKCFCYLPPGLTKDKNILLKDVYKQTDGIVADCHSRIIAFDCVCEFDSILSPDVFKMFAEDPNFSG